MAQPQEALLETLDQSLSAAVSAIAPSVLRLERGHGGGTALAWTEELAVTSNFHCPDRTAVLVPSGDDAGELEEREAMIVGRDRGLDLALLKVTGGGLRAPALRTGEPIAVGNLAIAVGRPGRSVRASLRMIGVVGRGVRTPAGGTLDEYVETDRLIPRGFAGGPLIDARGRVIGVNTRTLLRGHDLAVTPGVLELSVAELVQHGGVRRGYLGVGVTAVELSRSLAAARGRARGAMVSALEDDGPAERAGVQQGDILVSLDGAAIDGPRALRDAIAERPGAAVELELARAGALQKLAVTLGARP
ncbi:MAG: trypsin-like peptidase domain-containing protein [Kofleriaceae bacterium]